MSSSVISFVPPSQTRSSSSTTSALMNMALLTEGVALLTEGDAPTEVWGFDTVSFVDSLSRGQSDLSMSYETFVTSRIVCARPTSNHNP